MFTEKIDLYKYFKIEKPQGAEGVLTTYVFDEYGFCPNRKRPAMLVIAGGGYKYVSEREKEPVAMKFLEKGYNVFVLDYSVAPNHFPTQLIEGAMAIAYVKKNAKQLGVDKNHVGAIGFSAGGHLCGMLGTMFDDAQVLSALKNNAKYCRPDAVILSYAVLINGEKTNQATMQNISGGDEELKNYLSLEKKVTPYSSPAFIWTTVQDTCVPMESSLSMALAYRKAGVPFEFHAFEVGGHGLSVCSKESNRVNVAVQKWLDLAFTWLELKGFKIK